jgi:hypothetical protein
MQRAKRQRGWWLALSRSASLVLVMIAGAATIGTTVSSGYIVGRYNVEACTAAVGYANHTWTVKTNNTTFLETHTSCGEEPADYNSDVLANLELGEKTGLAEEIPVGTSGQWEFVAPAGTTIAEVTGYSSLYRQGRSWRVYRETENTKGELDVESSCDDITTNACRLGGTFQATALNAHRMIFGALCTAEEYEPGKFFTTCPDGALLHDVRAGIAYATVTLADPNPPEDVTATSIPSGPQHGTINVTGSARDLIAGLLSLSVVTSTGEVVGGPVPPGTCDYSQLTPCPTETSNQSISVDTTKLPDGNNELRIRATNAAHEDSYSAPFTITVQNHPAETKGTESGKPAAGSTASAPSSSSGAAPQEKPGGSASPGSVALPALKITLKAKLLRGNLHIVGHASQGARRTLRLVVDARLRGRRRWRTILTVRIHNGVFRATVNARRLRRRQAVQITVTYPSDGKFRKTVRRFAMTL